MNITKYGMAEDSVLNYLPTESPPENLVSNTLRGVQLPLVTRHTLSWISAVAAEFERQAMWRHIRGYRFATYGLADTDYEYVGFAVLAYADPVAFGPDPTLDLKVANHVFRVFCRTQAIRRDPTEDGRRGRFSGQKRQYHRQRRGCRYCATRDRRNIGGPSSLSTR